MFPKLFHGQCVQSFRVFATQIHRQICLNALFDHRRKVENEWNDDEDEQRNILHEEERKNFQKKKEQPLKCEITGKTKRPGLVDCSCKSVCVTKKSETYIIHYEGGVGIIQKN